MKKFLAIILSLALALTSAVAMMIPAFADDPVDPIVYNFTEEGASEVNWSGSLGHCWDGAVSGTSAYDADEKAWKMELTESYEGSWQGCYEVIHTGGAIDFSTYKYFAVCFKENMPEGQGPLLNKDGAVHVDYLSGGKDDFTKSIFETSLLGQGNDQIIVNLSSQGDSTGLTAGSAVWIKYIAFFATEEEAEAFEIVEEEPETSEPETSEPETSEPETSEPETSEPETSEPETSEPETSEPETSEPETSEPETNSDPIIFNYTVDDDPDTFYPDGGNFMYNWGSSVAGPSAYDADEQAWVMTSDVALGQYATAYEHIWNGSYTSVVDWNTYKYIVFVYKTAGGNETQHYAVMTDGAANVFELPASDGGYSKFVASTDAFHDDDNEVGYQILPGICNYGVDGSEPGVSLAIKYIAFFATEEEANAYDFGITEPETSEPETSEPETSEPETSEPETSEPETSEPETSEPETSEPEGSEESGEESGKEGADTSDIAMVSGAILLCAAAATIAVVSRKRK